MQTFKLDMVS